MKFLQNGDDLKMVMIVFEELSLELLTLFLHTDHFRFTRTTSETIDTLPPRRRFNITIK